MIEPTRGDTAPAIHVPNGAVTAATKPIISAAFTCTSLRFRFATLVVIEFGNMASSDVPRAIRSEALNSIDSAGTASAPPPISSSPAKMPITTPSSTRQTPVSTLIVMCWSRDGTKLIWFNTTNTRNTTKIHRNTSSGNRESNQLPICPPTNMPQNSSSAASQSTFPQVAYEMTPEIEVGTIASIDVAAALRCVKPSHTDPEFLHALVYTVLFTIVTTVVINVVAFAIAYMLTKAIKGSTLFRSVFFMPNLIGGIILGYIWLLLLNGVLAHWGRSITFSGVYGFWGMVLLTCWQQIGYMMIIYIAGLQGLPGDVIEAAAVDGANSRQTLFNVTIPLMMPSITVCTFLTVTNGFKMFDQNLALTNGAPSNSSELLALNIYRTFYGRAGFEGVGQAKAVVFFIIVAVIALIQNKLTTSKEVQA